MKRSRRLVLAGALAASLAACSGGGSVHERAMRHERPAVEGPGRYVVQRGDTLYSIAFRNQIDFHDLADWNGIGRSYVIYPGRVLRLTPPGSPELPPPARSATPIIMDAPATPPPRVPTVPPLPPDSAPLPLAAAPATAGEVEGPRFDPGRWEWPTRGKVARIFSADGSSKGLDIAGDAGQIVVAAGSGKVVYSGSALKGYGELVIIKHDEQFLSAYGYNRRRLVEEGQQVAAGQPIAELGLGPEQKPLLHFEIRDRGKPVDPLPLLPKRQ
jgi:lipoprotein NlpD